MDLPPVNSCQCGPWVYARSSPWVCVAPSWSTAVDYTHKGAQSVCMIFAMRMCGSFMINCLKITHTRVHSVYAWSSPWVCVAPSWSTALRLRTEEPLSIDHLPFPWTLRLLAQVGPNYQNECTYIGVLWGVYWGCVRYVKWCNWAVCIC